jgi:hypothetical protein
MMNKTDRKYRFTEIMTALSLLPDICEIEEHDTPCECYGDYTPDMWVLPNGAKGITDGYLRDALICQILKDDNPSFTMKAVGTFLNTAMTHINQDDVDEPSDEDLELIGLSCNIMWAQGNATGLFNGLGLLGRLCMIHGKDLPDIATMILRPNGSAQTFGVLDPNDILEGSLSKKAMFEMMKKSAEQADNE